MEFKFNSDPLNDGHYIYGLTGALTNDYHRRICMIKYNYLTLPQSVQFRRGDRIEYVYDASGVKRQTKHKVANRDMNFSYFSQSEPASSDFSQTTTTDYIGNKIYVNSQLKYILTEEGYIEKVAGAYTAHYYLNDRLGNNRVVFDAAGTLKQVNNYYPSGTSLAERRTDQDVQPYKFGGKELDLTNGINFYDFEARSFDPVLMRFTSIDPMAKKYPQISPYAYCMNNPIRYIDPTGMYPIYDEDGNFLGTDENGLQGFAFIMNKDNFKQGMSLLDVQKNTSRLKDSDEVRERFNKSYNSLSSRPDYDGFVTIDEGVAWALAHPGALDNPTPENSLYINTGLLDFGGLSVSDFAGLGIETPVNLFTTDNVMESAFNPTLKATVYALGRVDMVLLSLGVKIVNNSATDYDWNGGGGAVRNTFIQAERKRTGLNDSHGFKTFYYGIGTLRNYP